MVKQEHLLFGLPGLPNAEAIFRAVRSFRMPIPIESSPAEKTTPLVSIVIPVYNGMPYILRTIASVRRQTFTDWELIICDNASKDGTVACVQHDLRENPDIRIRLILQKKLLPMAENWNRSLAYAQGKFIKVLPSDDILFPLCIEIQQRILQENPDVGFVTSSKEIIDAEDRTLFSRRPLTQGKYDWQNLGHRTLRAVVNILGEPGAILFRKDLLESCGNYDPRFRYFVDIELLLRFLKISRAYMWGSPLYQFRIHGNSASASSRKIALDEYKQLLDHYRDELGFSGKPFLRPYLELKSRLVVLVRSLIFRKYNEIS